MICLFTQWWVHVNPVLDKELNLRGLETHHEGKTDLQLKPASTLEICFPLLIQISTVSSLPSSSQLHKENQDKSFT